jgi:glutamyl-tRNA reductase
VRIVLLGMNHRSAPLELREQLAVDDPAPQAVEVLTRSIANKILHAPLSRLRREAEREEGMAYLEAARVLFGLDDDLDPAGGR